MPLDQVVPVLVDVKPAATLAKQWLGLVVVAVNLGWDESGWAYVQSECSMNINTIMRSVF